MNKEIAVSFSAEAYRQEYQAMRNLMPKKADRVLEAVKHEFKDSYPKQKPTFGQKILKSVPKLGMTSVFAASGLGVAGVLAAPVAVPLGLLGAAAFGVASYFDRRGYGDPPSVESRIDHDLANGDLLKRYIEGMKRYGRELPSCFDAFSDRAMKVHYLPAPEARPLLMPASMALLSGSFNDNAPSVPETPASGADLKKKPEGLKP